MLHDHRSAYVLTLSDNTYVRSQSLSVHKPFLFFAHTVLKKHENKTLVSEFQGCRI